ncbi:hypothetical protein [Paraburkholderia lacunae]|uniref:GGDEF domain-containing protein n=1 Tax=Paraburkholderia lacunae TaxID=2211104 RepID=A0A370N5T4_9BURK|nr:hypothetical protein [Paraburkholderia lacunae]RDK00974.1 hypothetical protein DLM46_19305 [Paraburkholderia lacunae]
MQHFAFLPECNALLVLESRLPDLAHACAPILCMSAFSTRNLRVGDVFGRLDAEAFGVLCPATTAALHAVRAAGRDRMMAAERGGTR